MTELKVNQTLDFYYTIEVENATDANLDEILDSSTFDGIDDFIEKIRRRFGTDNVTIRKDERVDEELVFS